MFWLGFLLWYIKHDEDLGVSGILFDRVHGENGVCLILSNALVDVLFRLPSFCYSWRLTLQLDAVHHHYSLSGINVF